jgi:hypothetical protein
MALSALTLACAGLAIRGSAAWAQTSAGLTPKEARQIGVDAYIYGYSLITTEITRVQMSNIGKFEGGMRAPMGQFANVRRYPPADFRAVSAPNADTLYSVAWLDLAEPQVFSHPDMGKRFYLFEMTDLWMTDFENARNPNYRRESRQLSDHRSGLERHGPGRAQANQVRDPLHGHPGSHVR